MGKKREDGSVQETCFDDETSNRTWENMAMLDATLFELLKSGSPQLDTQGLHLLKTQIVTLYCQ